MNFIDIVTRDNNVTDIAKLNLRLTINAFTGALVREAQFYVQQRRRGIPSSDLPMDEEALAEHQTTIDDHSEDDRTNEAGETLDAQMRREQGYETRNPYRDMCTLNGLRHYVYNDLFRFVDVPKAKDALYFEAKRRQGEAINWDQPMSAERFLDFRIQVAGRVNERDLKDAMAEDPTADEVHLRRIFAESAIKRAAALKDLKLDILAEIVSLPEDTGDVEGFKTSDSSSFGALPAQTQVAIATKVRDGLQREHDRLQTIRSERMAAQRALIRDEIKIVNAALDKLVQQVRAEV